MKKALLIIICLATSSILNAQFYSFVWIQPYGYGSSDANVMSEYEFPYDPFHLKFNQQGEITDSSQYPKYQKYFVAGTITLDTAKNISASLVGMFTLCIECDYFIVYKKTSDDRREAYFVWDSWSFDGNIENAGKAFKKQLKKKVYKKKGFFEDGSEKYIAGNINGNKIFFYNR